MEPHSSGYLILPIFIVTLIIGGFVLYFLRRRNKSKELALKAEKRRSQQLGLLEEASRSIADSFDEQEILQRAINAVIHRFRYPHAVISKLVDGDMLEVAVFAGTQDYGYRRGYRQKIGIGIIGHTAEIRKTYITDNIEKDPYYFSNNSYTGSVICTPLFSGENFFGVLYIESKQTNEFDALDIKTIETLATHISASLNRATLYMQLQETVWMLSIVQNISKTISKSLDKDIISQQVLQALQESLGYTHISIYLLEDDYLHIINEVGYKDKSKVYRSIHISQGVHGRAIRTKSIQFIEDTSKDAGYLTADNSITSEICVPLIQDEKVIGTINVESEDTRKLTQNDVTLLSTIATPLAIAMDNARLHEEIKKMATTDAVTGLSNRHVFEASLVAEVERAQRSGSPVSLIIFDIDSFKEYNDTYGHPAGDARLKSIADIIKKNLRKYDIAARYGGDEFAIILSGSNQQNALNFATRLREATQLDSPQQEKNEHSSAGYTLSIGIATFPQDATTHNELLFVADYAAMRAKQLGKNRIRLASDSIQR